MSGTKMTKTPLAVITVLLLSSCASQRPPVEPEGDVAYLQNRMEHQGQARFDYFFEYADKQKLGPGPWSLTLPTKAVNKIPPGRTVIGLKIVYTPIYRKKFFIPGNNRYYYIFVRDYGFSEERIDYMNKKIAGVEPESLSGLRGLRFDAEEGLTYQIGSRIEGGQAHIWIEEPDGTIVSDTVLGIADAHCVTQTAFEAGMPSGCIPDPSDGWKVLDDLPDPVN